MLTEQATELLAALRRTLPAWDCAIDGDRVVFSGGGGGSYLPPRRQPTWGELLATLETACADHGISRAHPLPLHGLGDADLTFSAVQALDPYLKRRQWHTYGNGFLPQAVVRFTGDRDQHGALRPGFLTSFVNVSVVQPVGAISEHAELVDSWLAVLSRLGFHARHLTIIGSLATWNRTPVCGITLQFRHDGRSVSDAVLLWNADDFRFLATDIGSGLERLRWALTRRPWHEVVYGGLADVADARTLDAVRTATLIVGSGIRPAPRGPGSAVRRLLRDDADDRMGTLGLSRAVRWAHAYWNPFQPLPVPWPEVCRLLENEAFNDR